MCGPYVYVSPVCDFVGVGKADADFSHAAELVVGVVPDLLRPQSSAHGAVVAGESVGDGATVAVPGVTLQGLELCVQTHSSKHQRKGSISSTLYYSVKVMLNIAHILLLGN